MKQRHYLQEDRYDMGTSGTLTFNLDYSDPITSIDLLFEATNGATSNKNNPIESNISKIEIVDGGQVLWDLPGDVAFANIATLRGSMPHGYRTGAISDGTYQTIPLLFGRQLYDPMYAFNPIAHKNPQLKITFNEATVRAAGGTGFVSDSFTVSILVHLMEESPSPQGFLSCREVETFTSVASGDKRIEMPTDKTIRSLICRVYESGVDVRTDITRFKLSVDGGKFEPFDLYARNIVDTMIGHFQPMMIPQYTVSDNGEIHQTWVAIDLEAFVRDHTGSYIVGGASSWPGQMTIRLYTHAGVATTGKPVHFGVIGWLIHNTYVLPFGRLENPDEWLKTQAFNKLDLVLTQGGAGAEVNVCVQSLFTY